MGDRAGFVGYLLSSPLIQLEGLVLDSNYLNLLEKNRNIEEVLHFTVRDKIQGNTTTHILKLRNLITSPNNRRIYGWQSKPY